jgi:hypothetical protein
MKLTVPRLIIVAAAALVMAPWPTHADDYCIDWWTVDGGGNTWTASGDFELSGTIGQPDAGVMTGGEFELVGGFWARSAPASRPGDLNCDELVNFDDIDPFVLALTGQAAYEAVYPDCQWLNADCNGDGSVNFDDIDGFVALLAGG